MSDSCSVCNVAIHPDADSCDRCASAGHAERPTMTLQAGVGSVAILERPSTKRSKRRQSKQPILMAPPPPPVPPYRDWVVERPRKFLSPDTPLFGWEADPTAADRLGINGQWAEQSPAALADMRPIPPPVPLYDQTFGSGPRPTVPPPAPVYGQPVTPWASPPPPAPVAPIVSTPEPTPLPIPLAASGAPMSSGPLMSPVVSLFGWEHQQPSVGFSPTGLIGVTPTPSAVGLPTPEGTPVDDELTEAVVAERLRAVIAPALVDNEDQAEATAVVPAAEPAAPAAVIPVTPVEAAAPAPVVAPTAPVAVSAAQDVTAPTMPTPVDITPAQTDVRPAAAALPPTATAPAAPLVAPSAPDAQVETAPARVVPVAPSPARAPGIAAAPATSVVAPVTPAPAAKPYVPAPPVPLMPEQPRPAASKVEPAPSAKVVTDAPTTKAHPARTRTSAKEVAEKQSSTLERLAPSLAQLAREIVDLEVAELPDEKQTKLAMADDLFLAATQAHKLTSPDPRAVNAPKLLGSKPAATPARAPMRVANYQPQFRVPPSTARAAAAKPYIKTPTPERKRWTVKVGLAAAAVAAIAAYLAMSGASPSAAATRHTADANHVMAASFPIVSQTKVPGALFHYGTTGSAETVPFSVKGSFNDQWSANCEFVSTDSVVDVKLLSGAQVVLDENAVLSSTTEKWGTSRALPPGTYTLVATAPSTCTWSAEGTPAG